MRKVFISHTSDRDSVELVRFLARKLSEHGMEAVTLDEQIAPGRVVREAVQDAIKQCSVVIALIMRPSPYVFYEIGYADGIGKKIVILSESETALPTDLKTMRMVTFDPYDSSFVYRLLEVLEEEPVGIDEDKLDYLVREHPEEVFALFKEHRASFERLDNKSFEMIVANLFQRFGYQIDVHSDRSPASYDFLLRDFEGKGRVVVEVKKYSASSKISVGQVQQLLGAVAAERADLGLLIAPTDFTRTAADFASRCHPKIELWNLTELERRLVPS